MSTLPRCREKLESSSKKLSLSASVLCSTLFCSSDGDKPNDQIRATDQFCAAVVQHSALLGKMPTYSEYIEEVCPKRFKIGDDEDEAMETEVGGEAKDGEGAES